jgi:hypothetical protein
MHHGDAERPYLGAFDADKEALCTNFLGAVFMSAACHASCHNEG